MSLIEIINEDLNAQDAYPLSFHVEESLSLNPVYRLALRCREPDLDFDQLLGQRITVSIELSSGERRPYNAWIVGGEDCGQHGNHYLFTLHLSCWLWFLQQNRNCRIFQHLSVPEIIQQIFARYGLADYRLALENSYPPREYCVQFAESDFAFISRLMEDEGIGYVIEHSQDSHTLAIGDRQQFPALDEHYRTLLFTPDSEEGRAMREGIQRIQRQRVVSPNQIVLRDFDYLNPRKDLQIKVEDQGRGLHHTPLEWYDYATGYTDAERGEQLGQVRLQAFRMQGQTLSGESNALGLMPGKSFTLALHPDSRRNRGYKLLRCDYDFIQDGPDSSSQGRNIVCRFTAINDDLTWRPQRITPQPQLPGLQSATVVGPVDSEVHTDKHGRIRVHFHWDRDKTSEEDSSCWIRVVQAWAGKGWGVLAMPRVGQEVLVTYVDGDLDRPMVTGIVYNGDNPPPYRLPEQINYSGLVSRSLRAGQPQHASQITFDDKRGGERVMMHAERDLQTSIERNSVTDIGQDSYQVVKRTLTRETGNELTWTDNHMSVTDNRVRSTRRLAEKVDTRMTLANTTTTSTANSVSYTTLNTATTSSNFTTTGVDTSLTGISTSAVGVETVVAGVSTDFTAVNTSLVGQNNLFFGNLVAAVGSLIAVNGSTIMVVGSNITVMGSKLAVVGSEVEVIDFSMKVVGLKLWL